MAVKHLWEMGIGMADWSKALVRLVARLRSWVRVLAKPWTVEPSHLSSAGTLVVGGTGRYFLSTRGVVSDNF